MIQYIQHKVSRAIRIDWSEFCDPRTCESEVVLLETEGSQENAIWLHSRFSEGCQLPWLNAGHELLAHIINEAKGQAFCSAVRINKQEKGA